MSFIPPAGQSRSQGPGASPEPSKAQLKSLMDLASEQAEKLSHTLEALERVKSEKFRQLIQKYTPLIERVIGELKEIEAMKNELEK